MSDAMTLPTLTVYYSCPLCGAKNESVEVRARASPTEDITKWFTYMLNEVRAAHARRHLLCEPLELKDVMVPLPRDDPDSWIGKYTPPNPPPEMT